MWPPVAGVSVKAHSGQICVSECHCLARYYCLILQNGPLINNHHLPRLNKLPCPETVEVHTAGVGFLVNRDLGPYKSHDQLRYLLRFFTLAIMDCACRLMTSSSFSLLITLLRNLRRGSFPTAPSVQNLQPCSPSM